MDNFIEMDVPPSAGTMQTAAQFQSGPPITPVTRLLTYTSEEWESFIHEWVFSLKTKYLKVLRATGGGDLGIDVAGFTDKHQLEGVWDNYQCKYYDKPIAPSVAWPEIGKILWHSYNKRYVPPRAYFFVAPKGASTSLSLLLTSPTNLKAKLTAAWDTAVRDKIAVTPVPLTGPFSEYMEHFDYSIFQSVSPLEVIEQHRTTEPDSQI